MLKKEASPLSIKSNNNKKTYQQPALRVYGNIGSITATAGSAGNMDGGTVLGFMMTA
jgi:hypothetical protein